MLGPVCKLRFATWHHVAFRTCIFLSTRFTCEKMFYVTCRRSGGCALWKGRNLTFVLPGSTPSGHASLGSAHTGGHASVYQVATKQTVVAPPSLSCLIPLCRNQSEWDLFSLSCPSLSFSPWPFILNSTEHYNNIFYIQEKTDKISSYSPQPPRKPPSPPALWSRGPAPGSPCESSGATDEQTHSQTVSESCSNMNTELSCLLCGVSHTCVSPVQSCVWLSFAGISACHPDGGSFPWE